MEVDFDEALRPSTKWVKTELLDTLDLSVIDPRGHLDSQSIISPFDRINWFARVAKHWNSTCIPIIAHGWTEGEHCWLYLVNNDGTHGGSLSNWYSMAYRPIFSALPDDKLVQAIAKRLRVSQSVPPIITLSPVPRLDGSSDLIMQAFSRSGWFVMRHQSSTSWTVDVTGKSFDDYWAERPGQLRSTFQRKSKKSEIRTEIRTLFDDDGWAAYESVYGDSWKPEEGNAKFLRELAQSKSANGRYRLGLAWLGDQVIAAQFWEVDNRIAYIHKLAYRQDQRELSPGTILSAALFKHVIDTDQVTKIDFGTGNDAYKADWMGRSDPLDTIRMYKKSSLTGVVAAARARISALVRRVPLD